MKGSLQIEVVAGSHESFVLGDSGREVASIVQTFLKQTSGLSNGHWRSNCKESTIYKVHAGNAGENIFQS